jgi:hypothetical protein
MAYEVLDQQEHHWLREHCEEMLRAADLLDNEPTATEAQADFNHTKAEDLRRFARGMLILLDWNL